MKKYKVNSLVFSSTAAVYGTPLYLPIDANHPCNPLSPYGHSKLFVEQMIADYARAFGLSYTILRYFNAAGAHPEGLLGENHHPETHLIPLVLMAAAGLRDSFTVFGRDYDTPDGTCVRDYIHVQDLCYAHCAALKRLFSGKKSECFNLGSGHGYSVQQIIDAACRVSGRFIPILEGKRRHGDPEQLVADIRHAMIGLDWNPRFSDITTIIEHAWNWIEKSKITAKEICSVSEIS